CSSPVCSSEINVITARRAYSHYASITARLLIPLALRLQELVAGRAVIAAQWLKAGLAVITLPVVVWAGGQFYRGAWSGFKHRTADMNTLIGVGTGAAYLYSLAATVAPVAFTGA